MTPACWGPEKGHVTNEETQKEWVRESWVEEDALTCVCPHSAMTTFSEQFLYQISRKYIE